MKTVFSGIQPSGELHLGNYLGAVRNWVALQDQYPEHRKMYCVVDYHAITSDAHEPKEMPKRVIEMVIELLALGIDPERSIVFVQSMVPEHTELGWVFNTVTGFGELSRMTQFKDKSEHQPENINVGLFDYPVLQAADILLYRAELVPVGQDQLQHLELARDIARKFNHRYGKTFPECQPALTTVPKVLGIDGQQKMSKSVGNHIPMTAFGNDKQLRKYLAKCATDPKRVAREDSGNPDNCPTIGQWHKVFSTEADNAWVREGCTTAGIGCVDCKGKLGDNMTEHFKAFVDRRAEFVANPQRVYDILVDGAAKAREIAKRTMADVHKRLGLWRPPVAKA